MKSILFKINDANATKAHVLMSDSDIDVDLELDYTFHINENTGFGARHVQIIYTFLCLTISVAMKTNFSVAIVAMTDNTTSSNPNIPTYHWTNTHVILLSFFWSYIILQIAGGYMSKIYGPKILLLGSVFSNTIAFMFIPLSAKYTGSTGVIIMRLIQGLGQGCLFPCAHTTLGKWAPAEERSVLVIIVYSSLSCGSVLSLTITGLLCSSPLGWPSSFYFFGACGLIWCLLYYKFGHNSPASHPTISHAERRYIETSIGNSESDTEPPIPWKSILTCIHFWAIVSANIGGSWGFTALLTQVPTYLHKVMKFNIESNGIVSATPYIVSAVLGLVFGHLADYLIFHGYLSRLNTRRVFQISGSYVLVVCLLSLAYLTKTQLMAVITLSVGNAAYAATLIGYSVNLVDLSPRYAGVMHGISNCISLGVGLFSPLLVHIIVTKMGDEHWRIEFNIAALLYFVCSTVYAIFASATRQKWDHPEDDESIEDVVSIASKVSLHSMPLYE